MSLKNFLYTFQARSTYLKRSPEPGLSNARWIECLRCVKHKLTLTKAQRMSNFVLSSHIWLLMARSGKKVDFKYDFYPCFLRYTLLWILKKGAICESKIPIGIFMFQKWHLYILICLNHGENRNILLNMRNLRRQKMPQNWLLSLFFNIYPSMKSKKRCNSDNENTHRKCKVSKIWYFGANIEIDSILRIYFRHSYWNP